MTPHQTPVGRLIRDWRQRRRLSQLDLALEAEISQKHLSFVESGRSAPSRDMVILLAGHLGVPLRERNALLLAAGFAPLYPERGLDDPELAAARQAIDLVLKGHEPCPALALDRHYVMRAANACVAPLLAGIAEPRLLEPPVNVLRLSLHPGGLAPRIVNLTEWRAHLLARLRQQMALTGDPVLSRLFDEVAAYPASSGEASVEENGVSIVVPLRLRHRDAILSLISTTTVFGSPVDVTLSELALETFFPADAATGLILRGIASTPE